MTVLFYSGMLEYTGGVRSYKSSDSPDIRSLIDELGCHFGNHLKDFLLGDGNCFLLLNGKGIMATGGLDTRLQPGDKVEVLPFIEAG